MKILDIWVPITILIGILLIGWTVPSNAQQVWVPGPGSGRMQTWTEMETGRTKTFVYPQRYGYSSYGSGCAYCNPVDNFLQSWVRGYQAGAFIRQQQQRPSRSNWGDDSE